MTTPDLIGFAILALVVGVCVLRRGWTGSRPRCGEPSDIYAGRGARWVSIN